MNYQTTRKILQTKEEIAELRAKQTQRYCANCQKPLRLLRLEMVSRPREVLSRRALGFRDGRPEYEDVGTIVQHYEGYRWVPAFHAHAPFCSSKCAIAFAHAAYASGMRRKAP